MTRSGGFTMIELVVFIVVIGIATVGVMAAYIQALGGAGEGAELTRRAQFAQQRMELIIANKRQDGFPGFDPCPNGLEACNVPAGFTVASDIVEWLGVDPCDDTMTHCVITVTVTAPDGANYVLETLITRLSQ